MIHWHMLLRAAAAALCWHAVLPVSAQQSSGPPGTPLLVIEQGSHSAPVRRIDVHAERNLAVTASDDRTARVWRLSDGQLLQVLRPLAYGAEVGRLYGAAIHPSRPWVAVGGTTGDRTSGHRIYLFDTDTGAVVSAWDARAGDVRRLAWSADGSVLFAGYAGEHGIRAFDIEGRELLHAPSRQPAFGIAAARNGLVASVSLDGELRTYEAAAGTVRQRQSADLGGRRASGVAVSPDGSRLAVAFADVVDNRASRYVELFDAITLASMGRLPDAQAFGGDLRVVAWSHDGASIYAGGTAYERDLRFPVVRYDVAERRIAQVIPVARDSVTDLVALPQGGVVYSSFDGSWGTIDRTAAVRTHGSTTERVMEPAQLQLSGDATRARWAGGTATLTFAFAGRRAAPATAPAADWRSPQTSFGLFERPSDWNLAGAAPLVAGKRMNLASDERSRALAIAASSRSVFIGTNRALYRLDDKGSTTWRQPVDTEVRAVNTSEDGRIVVTAMADGTLRWWRTSDGTLVLNLLVTRAHQWIAWSPSGYYDAGVGADTLAGWAVGQQPSRAMDFHSLNRFRERYNRPDVIDALLKTLDLNAAAELLARRDMAAKEEAAREAAAREHAARQAELEVQRQATAAQDATRLRAQTQAAADQAQRERAAADEVARRQQAAQDAARREAEIEARRQEAVRVAQVEQQEAQRAAQEARLREDAVRQKKVLEVVKALEVPPSVHAGQAARVRAQSGEVSLPFSITAPDPRAEVKVEVRVNGRPAAPIDLVLPSRLDGSARGVAKLRLNEPESVVEIIARNEYGPSEPLRYTVESLLADPRARPAAGAAQGDLYVLAVGISAYRRPEYRLNLAAKDARDFAAAVNQQEGRLYRRVTARVLTDQAASRADVMRELEWLRGAVGPGDVAMLFVAGHGLNDAAGQYYFLPHDAHHEKLATTGVSQSTIVSTLSRIRGKTLFFVDTCYAGNTVGALSKSGRQAEKLINDLASAENGVVVFASSTGQQESEEKLDWGNGAFTKAVIEGLSGKADFTRAGRVTYAALNLYVSEEVVRLTDGRQRPVFISPRGIPDFALARL
jgi:WD40 repeat protein